MTQTPQTAVVPRPALPDGPRSADSEPPLKDVLVELWQNIEHLLRQELALASAELDAKTGRLKKELTAMAIGGGLALAGTLALVAALILLLDLVMAAWLAALLTGAAGVTAGVLLLKSHQPSARELTPERTIQNVKQDVQSFREATK